MRTIPLTLSIIALGLLASWGNAQLPSPSINSFNQQNQSPMPLPLHEAFPYYVSELGPGQYRVTFNPASGHYLYRHAFAFAMQLEPGATPEEISYAIPDGIKKTDQFFGQIEAYYNQVVVDVNLPTVPRRGALLSIEYQGCAEWGFCYPPQKASFELAP